MKVVLQRVSSATVSVSGERRGEIGVGILILLGIGEEDEEEDSTWLVNKILNLRIFADDAGLMNRSVTDVNGDVLVVSQFTLFAKTKKGNRPSYIKAARPEKAIPLYKQFIQKLEQAMGKSVSAGEFGADMKVSLTNDGPVTIIIDTKNKA